LILFTRRPVVQQFLAASALSVPSNPPSPSFLNNPLCPIPIRIVGWYLASFVFFFPFLPFLPAHSFPALYFGHLFLGPQAMLAHLLSYSLMAVAGFGLLLLKRWGYALSILTQALLLVGGLLTAFSPSLENQMRVAINQLGLPEPIPASSEVVLHHMRSFMLLGLLLPIAILFLLVFFRRPFFIAANSAAAR